MPRPERVFTASSVAFAMWLEEDWDCQKSELLVASWEFGTTTRQHYLASARAVLAERYRE